MSCIAFPFGFVKFVIWHNLLYSIEGVFGVGQKHDRATCGYIQLFNFLKLISTSCSCLCQYFIVYNCVKNVIA